MSKIAEKIHNVALQKAEEYSKTHGNSIIEEVAYGRGYKTAYIECYDQAMQAFLEKACEWLRYNTMRELLLNSESIELVEDFVDDFKNYMKDE